MVVVIVVVVVVVVMAVVQLSGKGRMRAGKLVLSMFLHARDTAWQLAMSAAGRNETMWSRSSGRNTWWCMVVCSWKPLLLLLLLLLFFIYLEVE